MDEEAKFVAEEEIKFLEAHEQVHELMADLLKDDCPPVLVAGIFQAVATKIYRTILTEEEFQRLMQTVTTTVSNNKETLH